MFRTIHNVEQLEDLLSEPSDADIAAIEALTGDLLVLGAGGKMGPSLVQRAQRAAQSAGIKKRVVAVARRPLAIQGVQTVTADLLDRNQVQALPDAENVIFMVGRKFGSTGNEPLTWATNTLAPALIAERFATSRIVALSTGNVYPLSQVSKGGATEATPPAPVGEYAQSVLARERIFEYFATLNKTSMAILRLNYAVDARYGVLLDIGQSVFDKKPVNLTMGHVNIIWQGDANSICLRSFALCESPPRVLNMTGLETLSVRAIASRFAEYFGIEPIFEGEESATALLSDASLCGQLLGPQSVSPDEMIGLVADWIGSGGEIWGKPTHFEVRTGQY